MPKTSKNAIYVFAATLFLAETRQAEIQEVFGRLCDKFVYQLEECPNTGNKHFQCYLKLKVKKRTVEIAKELQVAFSKGCHIRPASTAGKTALKDYSMKKATRIKGPWADHRIYMGQDLPTSLRDWQQDCKELITGPVHDRHIYWYTDKTGGTGKSTFCKYMAFHHKVVPLSFGSASDLLNLAFKTKNKECFIFDLSRTKSKKTSLDDVYAAIESIKNGLIVNTKYDTGFVLFDRPHVVVFSNYSPDMSKLSMDRWQITDITPDAYPDFLE